MDVTLADGRTISLSPGQAEALLDAAPLPDDPRVWSPVYLGAAGNAALVEGGLAERTREGFLGLTGLGHEVRARLPDPGAERGGAGAILDPALPEGERRALLAALARAGTARERDGRDRWGRTVLRVSYAVVLAYGACRLFLDLSGVWTVLVVLATGVVVLVPSAGAGREGGLRDPRRVTESMADRYVLPEQVKGEYRALLERTRRAVDAVLGSGPHREGLLLDTVRNEVVLAETEWTVARGLAGLARSLQEIESTPVTGERSRAAAARALAALTQERGRLEGRIRLLEEYADRVRAAEEKRIDAVSARELESIADRITEAGAAHEHQEAELRSLVSAQEAALRLAELTEGG
ncbi:hypothetical protein SUDANB121_04203 [Nocardiopsis dassonvillei]|uniref:hypothetical protein n=1 Tax=Nocardiopsis dassonvillei TaxID=2014 RepID=UPI003F570317